jgi:N-acetylneuraminic acid mutarotase
MRKKCNLSSASRGRHALLPLLVAACFIVSGTLLPFFRSETSAKTVGRTLTFQERVAYQRAIEGVYWRHRIWPKERTDPKPPLDTVMSQVQLEKKVTDYLRNSQALEDYWQRPITAEQLQAEMDRMAKHTRQPEILQELFEALGNDPFVIAECLARPALAQRLLTSRYAYDQRIHGELKQRAEAELLTHPRVEQMKQLSGPYSEVEFNKGRSREAVHNRGSQRGMNLDGKEWDEIVKKLRAAFDQSGSVHRASRHVATHSTTLIGGFQNLPVGKLSSLQEDTQRYYAIAIVEKTDDRFTLATVTWPKISLEAWLAKAEAHTPTAILGFGIDYKLPAVTDGGCVDDTWVATPGPPDGRQAHTAVWTGSEMIVWGGLELGEMNTGGRYDPAIDNWVPTNIANAPHARAGHTAVWTGTEMIVWGGSFFDDVFGPQYLNTGGKYNPSVNSWTETSTTNAPEARGWHVAVWTGSEMVVWGGFGLSELNTGGKYNPSTNSWSATSTINVPVSRSDHTAVWTGTEMIIWGGYSSETGDYLNTGGRYNPNTDSWTSTSTNNSPIGRSLHTAVWTGTEMIVWGGANALDKFNTGARYTPATDTWVPTSTNNVPTARSGHVAIWTGSNMVVWSGFDNVIGLTNTGGRYNPTTNTWHPTDSTGAPSARTGHTVVWTGSDVIVWGGYYFDGDDHWLTTGGRYDPQADSWAATGTADVPTGRYYHTAVWTGTDMIIWGGKTRDLPYLDTGGKYDTITDTWTATSGTNAPAGRIWHTAVWTGDRMIIWGGFIPPGTDTQTGAQYDPATNAWTATSTVNAPNARDSHTAVWTGNEMIVWGGIYDDGSNFLYLNTGGKYNPITNTWAATSSTNVPNGRAFHTAIWSNREMIVWGGYFNDGNDHYVNTGGRYNPATDSWIPTGTINAPSPRSTHAAVWTGSEMIIWGGASDTGYLATGGRYNPAANNWTAISNTNVPEARTIHGPIWTGSEMLIWGGSFFDGSSHYLNTGGRYNPATNSWIATSLVDTPAGRTSHAAVWTGNEMIVWGGVAVANLGMSTGGRYCGQSGPPPTPTPTPRVTPRPRPTPRVRPTPSH